MTQMSSSTMGGSPTGTAPGTHPPANPPAAAPPQIRLHAGAEQVPMPALAPRVVEVTHETVYQYAAPVQGSRHVFRLVPTHDVGQTLIESDVSVSVPGRARMLEDVFGNTAVHYEIEGSYTELRVAARSVLRLDPPAVPELDARLPQVWMPWQRQLMLPYLLPPELPESQLQTLSDYAMEFVTRHDGALAVVLEDMNRTIFQEFAYEPGSTGLETSPFEVYTQRRGVCQDFANLLICLCRLLGMPARYRVGYLFTGSNYENTLQAEASHAWVEVYLPQVGWRGYDPTNGCLVGRDHVRVAAGRHYRDAAPTSGTLFGGGGGETLSVDVKVVERG